MFSPQGGSQYLPLGPRFEFPTVHDVDSHKPPTRRRYLFNMMASLDTHPDRKALHDRLTAAVAEAKAREEGGKASGGARGGKKSATSSTTEESKSLSRLSSGYDQRTFSPLVAVPLCLEMVFVPTILFISYKT